MHPDVLRKPSFERLTAHPAGHDLSPRTRPPDASPLPLNSPLILQVEGLSLAARPRDDREEWAMEPGATPNHLSRPRLLQDISFSLRAGECLAILGDSGAGKSLLLRAIANHLPPGVIQVAGYIRQPRHRGNPLLGWVGQHAAAGFDPLWTVGQHLANTLQEQAWGRPSPGVKTRTWLTHLGLPAETAQQLPAQLSGGMARRAALAWALSGGAPLILADEPSTGADPIRLLEMAQLLEGLREQGVALLLVTHELRLAQRLADSIGYLAEGRLTFQHRASFPQRVTGVDANDGGEPLQPPLPPPSEGPPRTDPTLSSSNPGDRTRVNSPSEPPPQLGPQPPPLHLSLRGLTYLPPGSTLPVLRGLDWDLTSGERVGVTGLSGAGKSTLARLLAGLLRPTDHLLMASQQLRINDMSVWSHRSARLERAPSPLDRVQLVLQEPTAVAHPRLQVWEALRETLQRHRPELTEDLGTRHLQQALQTCHLTHRAGALVGTLSGGELRRLGLTRAVLANPRLLILDEPSAGLDPSHRLRLIETLQHLPSTMAVVCISHDLELLRQVCQRISILHEGQWLEHLSVEALGSPQAQTPDSATQVSANDGHSPRSNAAPRSQLTQQLLSAWEALHA